MSESDKVKIKLSELTDMYDIEDDSKDTKNIPEKEQGNVIASNAEVEEHEEQLERELEEEFDNA